MPDAPSKTVLYTIGHSTRPLAEFVALLKEFGIESLVDIRSIPGSSAFPQYNRQELQAMLVANGVEYVWLPSLGGRRRSRKDFESPNTGLNSPAFRAYADYMAGPEFRQGIRELMTIAARSTIAIMCAEAVYWRCHRRLVSDYLSAHGVEVRHILGPRQLRPHMMTPEATVHPDGSVTYPPPLEVGGKMK